MSSIEFTNKKWALKGNITFSEILLLLEKVNHYDWSESIELDLSDVKEIDTVLISFILEQKRQAKKFNKEFIVSNSPETLKSLLKLYDIEKLI